MEEFVKLSTMLRDDLKNYYEILKEIYYNSKSFDSNIDYDNIEEDEFCECIENTFEEDVFNKLIKYIKSNNYKEIIYLILFEDIYEYIKSKQISNLKLYDYEKKMLNNLENLELIKLIKNLNNDQELLLDYLTIFFEYQFENTEETKIKNKKLIELSNNQKYLNKFNISILDDLQYQYTKTRK